LPGFYSKALAVFGESLFLLRHLGKLTVSLATLCVAGGHRGRIVGRRLNDLRKWCAAESIGRLARASRVFGSFLGGI